MTALPLIRLSLLPDVRSFSLRSIPLACSFVLRVPPLIFARDAPLCGAERARDVPFARAHSMTCAYLLRSALSCLRSIEYLSHCTVEFYVRTSGYRGDFMECGLRIAVKRT